MSLNFLLPMKGLAPASAHYPRNSETHWADSDSEKNFRARGGHSIYGEQSITYRFNSLGYRCPEFNAPGEVRIISVGCSHTMGIGLPQEEIFHERFAERLQKHTGRSVVNWNLGAGAMSNDYITRTLFLAIPFLNPDLVLVNFTYLGRREYISVENMPFSFLPKDCLYDDYARRDIWRHFQELTSPYDDELNFFRNYKAVEALLSDRCWLFSTSDAKGLDRLNGHVNLANYVGNLVYLDKARDHMHAGPKSHLALATAYWEKFLLRGELYRGARRLTDRAVTAF
jgi:hypothetical protein